MAAVVVRGFDFGTTPQQIKAHCSTVGPVKSVELKGKGKALVTYTSAAKGALAVATLDQTIIDGNTRYLDVMKGEVGGAVTATAVKAQGQKRKAAAGDSPTGVFVRGYDFGTTDEELESHMGSVGTIVGIERRSKGSAIVTYSSAEEAEAAVTAFDKSTIEGNQRFIDVKIDEEEPTPPASKVKRLASFGGRKDPPGSGRVFIRGFEFGTTDEQFSNHCSTVGTILKVHWVTKGSAVVVYSTKAEAKLAAETLNGTTVEGQSRYIDVLLKDSE